MIASAEIDQRNHDAEDITMKIVEKARDNGMRSPSYAVRIRWPVYADWEWIDFDCKDLDAAIALMRVFAVLSRSELAFWEANHANTY